MNAIRSHLFKGARATELFPIFADVEAYPSFVPGLKRRRFKSEVQQGSIDGMAE